jgi:hypothetical protein
VISHIAVKMNQQIKSLSERLRIELNQDARAIDYPTAYHCLDDIEKICESLRAELVDAQRADDRSWEYIAKIMGRSRQAVWEKYS